MNRSVDWVVAFLATVGLTILGLLGTCAVYMQNSILMGLFTATCLILLGVVVHYTQFTAYKTKIRNYK